MPLSHTCGRPDRTQVFGRVVGGTILGVTPSRVFVYGTLLPGEERWPLLEPFALGWEAASVRGALFDTGYGYPALVLAEGEGDENVAEVPGVVVELEPERLAAAVRLLDRIEGDGHLFRRVEVQTRVGPAFTYEWLGGTDGMPRIDRWPA